jgi:hypothetical protein
MSFLMNIIEWLVNKTVTKPAEIDADRLRKAVRGSDIHLERSWRRDNNWR